MRNISVLYHGTAAENITRFQIGINTTGEVDDPVNGIWLGSAVEGAFYHARRVVAPRRKTTKTYVYKCTLQSDAVIADTKRSRLPPRVFKLLVERYLPWYVGLAYKVSPRLGRKLVPNVEWYKIVHKIALSRLGDRGPDQLLNAVIDVCKDIGIDVIANPSASIQAGEIWHCDETAYGTVALLINCDKCVIHAKVDAFQDYSETAAF